MESSESYEEVVNEFLRKYLLSFKRGGLSRLYYSKKNIMEQLIFQFGRNGYNSEKISNLIKICDKEFDNYIQEKKILYFSCIDEERDKELIKREIMSTAHQQELL